MEREEVLTLRAVAVGDVTGVLLVPTLAVAHHVGALGVMVVVDKTRGGDRSVHT